MPVSFGSHLIEGGDGSRRVAAEAVAPLDGGDDALEVGAVQQLGELQEAVAQDEELAGGGEGARAGGQRRTEFSPLRNNTSERRELLGAQTVVKMKRLVSGIKGRLSKIRKVQS